MASASCRMRRNEHRPYPCHRRLQRHRPCHRPAGRWKPAARLIVLDRDPPPADLPARFISVDMMSADAYAGALQTALGGRPRSPGSRTMWAWCDPRAWMKHSLADLEAVMRLNLHTAVQCTQGPARRECARRGSGASSTFPAARPMARNCAPLCRQQGGPARPDAHLGAGTGPRRHHGECIAPTPAPGTIATPLFMAANPEGSHAPAPSSNPCPWDAWARRMTWRRRQASSSAMRRGFITGQTLAVAAGITVGKGTV